MVIRWKPAGLVVLCAFAMLMAVPPAYATGDISVTIDGLIPPNPSPVNCASKQTCYNIGGTYNGLAVEPISVGAGQSAYARVNTPIADTSTDNLQITNTRIINNSGSDKTFIIEMQQPGSPLPANQNLWYNTYLNGMFDDLNGNFIEVKPYVKVGSAGSWQQAWSATRPFISRTVTDCPNPCSTAVLSSSILKTGTTFNPLASDRSLKVVFRITLKNGSYVLLNSGGKIMVSANPPDEPPPPPPLSAWCMTTNSTAKTFGCPSCMTQDGQVAADAKTKLFASTNWDDLQQDFARGEGEHLASLATLMDIPADRRSEFFALAQDQYRASTRNDAPEQVVASLQAAWNRQYQEAN